MHSKQLNLRKNQDCQGPNQHSLGRGYHSACQPTHVSFMPNSIFPSSKANKSLNPCTREVKGQPIWMC
ncbi:hypothetical protein AGOR_G00155370 [Albula goreensis]|uniref:Uncharacterized protein n=1 Tax=Albula goreensis TaxID=1534307 RepID=A0A8T3CZ49_9TELE|nr:hypothetical protein AGOR_G00155370 [Albula goreensis]